MNKRFQRILALLNVVLLLVNLLTPFSLLPPKEVQAIVCDEVDDYGKCVNYDKVNLTDLCKNISGTQTVVPSGKTRTADGNCLDKTSADLCNNIGGIQAVIPTNKMRNADGSCSDKTQVDLCRNIDGLQTVVPTNKTRNTDGTCSDKIITGGVSCGSGASAVVNGGYICSSGTTCVQCVNGKFSKDQKTGDTCKSAKGTCAAPKPPTTYPGQGCGTGGKVKNGAYICTSRYECVQCTDGRFGTQQSTGAACKGAAGTCSDGVPRPTRQVIINNEVRDPNCKVWCSGCGGFCGDKSPNLTCTAQAKSRCNEAECWEFGVNGCSTALVKTANCVNDDGTACYAGYKNMRDEGGQLQVLTYWPHSTCPDGSKPKPVNAVTGAIRCWVNPNDVNVQKESAALGTQAQAAMNAILTQKNIDYTQAAKAQEVIQKCTESLGTSVATCSNMVLNNSNYSEAAKAIIVSQNEVNSVLAQWQECIQNPTSPSCGNYPKELQKLSSDEKAQFWSQQSWYSTVNQLTTVLVECKKMTGFERTACEKEATLKYKATPEQVTVAGGQAASQIENDTVNSLYQLAVSGSGEGDQIAQLKRECAAQLEDAERHISCSAADLKQYALSKLNGSYPEYYQQAFNQSQAMGLATNIIQGNTQAIKKACEQDAAYTGQFDYGERRSGSGCTDTAAYVKYITNSSEFSSKLNNAEALAVLQGTAASYDPITAKKCGGGVGVSYDASNELCVQKDNNGVVTKAVYVGEGTKPVTTMMYGYATGTTCPAGKVMNDKKMCIPADPVTLATQKYVTVTTTDQSGRATTIQSFVGCQPGYRLDNRFGKVNSCIPVEKTDTGKTGWQLFWSDNFDPLKGNNFAAAVSKEDEFATAMGNDATKGVYDTAKPSLDKYDAWKNCENVVAKGGAGYYAQAGLKAPDCPTLKKEYEDSVAELVRKNPQLNGITEENLVQLKDPDKLVQFSQLSPPGSGVDIATKLKYLELSKDLQYIPTNKYVDLTTGEISTEGGPNKRTATWVDLTNANKLTLSGLENASRVMDQPFAKFALGLNRFTQGATYTGSTMQADAQNRKDAARAGFNATLTQNPDLATEYQLYLSHQKQLNNLSPELQQAIKAQNAELSDAGWEMARGTMISAAKPAATAVMIAALPLLPVALGAAPLTLAGGMSIGGTAFGVANTFNSLGAVGTECDESDVDCWLAVGNTAFSAISTGVGVVGGNAVLANSLRNIPGSAGAVTTGTMTQIAKNADPLLAEAVQGMTAGQSTAFQITNKVVAGMGAVVFGGQGVNAMVKNDGKCDFNCMMSFGMAAVSVSRFFMPLNGGASVGVDKVVNGADDVVNGAQAAVACSAALTGAGRTDDCTNALAGFGLGMGNRFGNSESTLARMNEIEAEVPNAKSVYEKAGIRVGDKNAIVDSPVVQLEKLKRLALDNAGGLTPEQQTALNIMLRTTIGDAAAYKVNLEAALKPPKGDVGSWAPFEVELTNAQKGYTESSFAYEKAQRDYDSYVANKENIPPIVVDNLAKAHNDFVAKENSLFAAKQVADTVAVALKPVRENGELTPAQKDLLDAQQTYKEKYDAYQTVKKEYDAYVREKGSVDSPGDNTRSILDAKVKAAAEALSNVSGVVVGQYKRVQGEAVILAMPKTTSEGRRQFEEAKQKFLTDTAGIHDEASYKLAVAELQNARQAAELLSQKPTSIQQRLADLFVPKVTDSLSVKVGDELNGIKLETGQRILVIDEAGNIFEKPLLDMGSLEITDLAGKKLAVIDSDIEIKQITNSDGTIDKRSSVFKNAQDWQTSKSSGLAGLGETIRTKLGDLFGRGVVEKVAGFKANQAELDSIKGKIAQAKEQNVKITEAAPTKEAMTQASDDVATLREHLDKGGTLENLPKELKDKGYVRDLLTPEEKTGLMKGETSAKTLMAERLSKLSIEMDAAGVDSKLLTDLQAKREVLKEATNNARNHSGDEALNAKVRDAQKEYFAKLDEVHNAVQNRVAKATGDVETVAALTVLRDVEHTISEADLLSSIEIIQEARKSAIEDIEISSYDEKISNLVNSAAELTIPKVSGLPEKQQIQLEVIIRDVEHRLSITEGMAYRSIRANQLDTVFKLLNSDAIALELTTAGGKTTLVGSSVVRADKELYGRTPVFVAKQGQVDGVKEIVNDLTKSGETVVVVKSGDLQGSPEQVAAKIREIKEADYLIIEPNDASFIRNMKNQSDSPLSRAAAEVYGKLTQDVSLYVDELQINLDPSRQGINPVTGDAMPLSEASVTRAQTMGKILEAEGMLTKGENSNAAYERWGEGGAIKPRRTVDGQEVWDPRFTVEAQDVILAKVGAKEKISPEMIELVKNNAVELNGLKGDALTQRVGELAAEAKVPGKPVDLAKKATTMLDYIDTMNAFAHGLTLKYGTDYQRATDATTGLNRNTTVPASGGAVNHGQTYDARLLPIMEYVGARKAGATPDFTGLKATPEQAYKSNVSDWLADVSGNSATRAVTGNMADARGVAESALGLEQKVSNEAYLKIFVGENASLKADRAYQVSTNDKAVEVMGKLLAEGTLKTSKGLDSNGNLKITSAYDEGQQPIDLVRDLAKQKNSEGNSVLAGKKLIIQVGGDSYYEIRVTKDGRVLDFTNGKPTGEKISTGDISKRYQTEKDLVTIIGRSGATGDSIITPESTPGILLTSNTTPQGLIIQGASRLDRQGGHADQYVIVRDNATVQDGAKMTPEQFAAFEAKTAAVQVQVEKSKTTQALDIGLAAASSRPFSEAISALRVVNDPKAAQLADWASKKLLEFGDTAQSRDVRLGDANQTTLEARNAALAAESAKWQQLFNDPQNASYLSALHEVIPDVYDRMVANRDVLAGGNGSNKLSYAETATTKDPVILAKDLSEFVTKHNRSITQDSESKYVAGDSGSQTKDFVAQKPQTGPRTTITNASVRVAQWLVNRPGNWGSFFNRVPGIGVLARLPDQVAHQEAEAILAQENDGALLDTAPVTGVVKTGSGLSLVLGGIGNFFGNLFGGNQQTGTQQAQSETTQAQVDTTGNEADVANTNTSTDTNQETSVVADGTSQAENVTNPTENITNPTNETATPVTEQPVDTTKNPTTETATNENANESQNKPAESTTTEPGSTVEKTSNTVVEKVKEQATVTVAQLTDTQKMAEVWAKNPQTAEALQTALEKKTGEILGDSTYAEDWQDAAKRAEVEARVKRELETIASQEQFKTIAPENQIAMINQATNNVTRKWAEPTRPKTIVDGLKFVLAANPLRFLIDKSVTNTAKIIEIGTYGLSRGLLLAFVPKVGVPLLAYDVVRVAGWVLPKLAVARDWLSARGWIMTDGAWNTARMNGRILGATNGLWQAAGTYVESIQLRGTKFSIWMKAFRQFMGFQQELERGVTTFVHALKQPGKIDGYKARKDKNPITNDLRTALQAIASDPGVVTKYPGLTPAERAATVEMTVQEQSLAGLFDWAMPIVLRGYVGLIQFKPSVVKQVFNDVMKWAGKTAGETPVVDQPVVEQPIDARAEAQANYDKAPKKMWDATSLTANYAQMKADALKGVKNVADIEQQAEKLYQELAKVPPITLKDDVATAIVMDGNPLLSAYRLAGNENKPMGHTSQIDIDRGLNNFVFTSWGKPEGYGDRYGKYSLVLNPDVLQRPGTVVTIGDIVSWNMTETKYSKSAVTGDDYLHLLSYMAAVSGNTVEQLIQRNGIDRDSVLNQWLSGAEVKVMDRIDAADVKVVVVPTAADKAAFISSMTGKKLPITIYAWEDLLPEYNPNGNSNPGNYNTALQKLSEGDLSVLKEGVATPTTNKVAPSLSVATIMEKIGQLIPTAVKDRFNVFMKWLGQIPEDAPTISKAANKAMGVAVESGKTQKLPNQTTTQKWQDRTGGVWSWINASPAKGTKSGILWVVGRGVVNLFIAPIPIVGWAAVTFIDGYDSIRVFNWGKNIVTRVFSGAQTSVAEEVKIVATEPVVEKPVENAVPEVNTPSEAIDNSLFGQLQKQLTEKGYSVSKQDGILIFKTKPVAVDLNDPVVRVYRGIGSRETTTVDTILNQVAYAVRDIDDATGKAFVVEAMKPFAERMVSEPTYQHLLELRDAARTNIKSKQVLARYDELVSDVEKGLGNGTTVRQSTAFTTVLALGGYADAMGSPYLSATTDLEEAVGYGREGQVLVMDVPLSQLSYLDLDLPGEVMIGTKIDPAYIRGIVDVKGVARDVGIARLTQAEVVIDTQLGITSALTDSQRQQIQTLLADRNKADKEQIASSIDAVYHYHAIQLTQQFGGTVQPAADGVDSYQTTFKKIEDKLMADLTDYGNPLSYLPLVSNHEYDKDLEQLNLLNDRLTRVKTENLPKFVDVLKLSTDATWDEVKAARQQLWERATRAGMTIDVRDYMSPGTLSSLLDRVIAKEKEAAKVAPKSESPVTAIPVETAMNNGVIIYNSMSEAVNGAADYLISKGFGQNTWVTVVKPGGENTKSVPTTVIGLKDLDIPGQYTIYIGHGLDSRFNMIIDDKAYGQDGSKVALYTNNLAFDEVVNGIRGNSGVIMKPLSNSKDLKNVRSNGIIPTDQVVVPSATDEVTNLLSKNTETDINVIGADGVRPEKIVIDEPLKIVGDGVATPLPTVTIKEIVIQENVDLGEPPVGEGVVATNLEKLDPMAVKGDISPPLVQKQYEVLKDTVDNPSAEQVRNSREATAYRRSVSNYDMVDIEHYAYARKQLKSRALDETRLRAVATALGIELSRSTEEIYQEIDQKLANVAFLKQQGFHFDEIIDLINGDGYKYNNDNRYDNLVEGQNAKPRQQSVFEAVANSIDALLSEDEKTGDTIGQFGKGIKQALAWLSSNAKDKVEVWSREANNTPHKITIIKDTQGQYYIQLDEVSLAEYLDQTQGNQSGTTIKITIKDTIPENAAQVSAAQFVSQEEILNGVHARYKDAPRVQIRTQQANKAAEIVNGYDTKQQIVPTLAPIQHGFVAPDGTVRDVLIKTDNHSVTVIDNGKGMNASVIASMFVPQSGDKHPEPLTGAAVLNEAKKVRVIHDTKTTLSNQISFVRNGETIMTHTIPTDIVSAAVTQHSLSIDGVRLFDVSDARDTIKPDVVQNGQISNFATAIMTAVKGIAENDEIAVLDRLKYVNTIVVGIEELKTDANAHLINEIKKQVKGVIAPLLESIQPTYAVLPHDIQFAKLAVPEGKQGIVYLDAALFNWQGSVSLKAVGATQVNGVFFGEKQDIPLLMTKFTSGQVAGITSFDPDYSKKSVDSWLQVVKTDRFVVVPEEFGKRLLELADLYAKRKIAEDSPAALELKSLIQALNIHSTMKVVTSYETAAELPKNIQLSRFDVEEGQVDSDALRDFLQPRGSMIDTTTPVVKDTKYRFMPQREWLDNNGNFVRSDGRKDSNVYKSMKYLGNDNYLLEYANDTKSALYWKSGTDDHYINNAKIIDSGRYVVGIDKQVNRVVKYDLVTHGIINSYALPIHLPGNINNILVTDDGRVVFHIFGENGSSNDKLQIIDFRSNEKPGERSKTFLSKIDQIEIIPGTSIVKLITGQEVALYDFDGQGVISKGSRVEQVYVDPSKQLLTWINVKGELEAYQLDRHMNAIPTESSLYGKRINKIQWHWEDNGEDGISKEPLVIFEIDNKQYQFLKNGEHVQIPRLRLENGQFYSYVTDGGLTGITQQVGTQQVTESGKSFDPEYGVFIHGNQVTKVSNGKTVPIVGKPIGIENDLVLSMDKSSDLYVNGSLEGNVKYMDENWIVTWQKGTASQFLVLYRRLANGVIEEVQSSIWVHSPTVSFDGKYFVIVNPLSGHIEYRMPGNFSVPLTETEVATGVINKSAKTSVTGDKPHYYQEGDLLYVTGTRQMAGKAAYDGRPYTMKRYLGAGYYLVEVDFGTFKRVVAVSIDTNKMITPEVVKDGNRLVGTYRQDGKFHVTCEDLRSGTPLYDVEVPDPYAIRVSDDGTDVVLVESEGIVVPLVKNDVVQSRNIIPSGSNTGVLDAHFIPGTHIVVSGNEKNGYHLLRFDRDLMPRKFDHVQLDSKGEYAVLTSGNELLIYYYATGRLITNASVGGKITSVTRFFGQNGSQVIIYVEKKTGGILGVGGQTTMQEYSWKYKDVGEGIYDAEVMEIDSPLDGRGWWQYGEMYQVSGDSVTTNRSGGLVTGPAHNDPFNSPYYVDNNMGLFVNIAKGEVIDLLSDITYPIHGRPIAISPRQRWDGKDYTSVYSFDGVDVHESGYMGAAAYDTNRGKAVLNANGDFVYNSENSDLYDWSIFEKSKNAHEVLSGISRIDFTVYWTDGVKFYFQNPKTGEVKVVDPTEITVQPRASKNGIMMAQDYARAKNLDELKEVVKQRGTIVYSNGSIKVADNVIKLIDSVKIIGSSSNVFMVRQSGITNVDGLAIRLVELLGGDVEAENLGYGIADAPTRVNTDGSSSPASTQENNVAELWNEKVATQTHRDKLRDNARKSYMTILEMLPEEMRDNRRIKTFVSGVLMKVYRDKEANIELRFRENPQRYVWSSQDAALQFEQRLNAWVNAGLADYLALRSNDLDSQSQDVKNEFYYNLIHSIFSFAESEDSSLAISGNLFNTSSFGWDMGNKNASLSENDISAIGSMIDSMLGLATFDGFVQTQRLVKFLSDYAHTPADLAVITKQIDRLLQLDNPQILQEIITQMKKVTNTDLQRFANSHDATGVNGDALPYLRFLTNDAALVREIASTEHADPVGQKVVMNKVVSIPAIQKLERMRQGEGTLTIDELIQAITTGKVYGLDLSDGQSIADLSELLKNISVQRESGAYAGEVTQNSLDATRNLSEKGKLTVDYYTLGDEFVEEMTDNGTGAINPVALLIPKSEKMTGGQTQTVGFFGTGKFTIYEGADRVEIITNSGDLAYKFNLEVVRDEFGKAQNVVVTGIEALNGKQFTKGVTVRRIKHKDHIIPELDAMIAQRSWKVFAGLTQNEQFEISVTNGFEVKDGVKVPKTEKVNVEGLETLTSMPIKVAVRDPKPTESKYVEGDVKVYSAKDMPLMVVDRAGLRVSEYADPTTMTEEELGNSYFALIPKEYLPHIKELGLIIQIPLPLNRDRKSFANEDFYLKEIQKYVAVAFLQSLAYKKINDADRFSFMGYSEDALENAGNYRDQFNPVIHPEVTRVMHVAKLINDNRLNDVSFADLQAVMTMKSDQVVKLTKQLMVYDTVSGEKISLFLRRLNVLAAVDPVGAVAEGGFFSALMGALPDIKKIAAAGKGMADRDARVEMGKGVLQGQMQMQTPEVYEVRRPLSVVEQRLLTIGSLVTKLLHTDFEIDEVKLVDNVQFAGAFKQVGLINRKNVMFLNIDLAYSLGQEAYGGAKVDETTDTIIHELAHLLEELQSGGKPWSPMLVRGAFGGFMSSMSTHQPIGTFADAMKYISGRYLAEYKKYLDNGGERIESILSTDGQNEVNPVVAAVKLAVHNPEQVIGNLINEATMQMGLSGVVADSVRAIAIGTISTVRNFSPSLEAVRKIMDTALETYTQQQMEQSSAKKKLNNTAVETIQSQNFVDDLGIVAKTVLGELKQSETVSDQVGSDKPKTTVEATNVSEQGPPASSQQKVDEVQTKKTTAKSKVFKAGTIITLLFTTALLLTNFFSGILSLANTPAVLPAVRSAMVATVSPLSQSSNQFEAAEPTEIAPLQKAGVAVNPAVNNQTVHAYVAVSSDQMQTAYGKFGVFLADTLNEYNDLSSKNSGFVQENKISDFVNQRLQGTPYNNLLGNDKFQDALILANDQSGVETNEEVTCYTRAALLQASGLATYKGIDDLAGISALKAKSLVNTSLVSVKNGKGNVFYADKNGYYVMKNPTVNDVRSGDGFVLYGPNQNHIGTILEVWNVDGEMRLIIDDANYNQQGSEAIIEDGMSRIKNMTWEEFVAYYGGDVATIGIIRKDNPVERNGMMTVNAMELPASAPGSF